MMIPQAPQAHWCQLIEGLQASPSTFYKSVEAALDRRQIPRLERSYVLWPEGGLVSAKRQYLRLTGRGMLFDICAAPFGTGFFVSYRRVDRQIPWLLIALAFLFAGLVLICTIFLGMFIYILVNHDIGDLPAVVLFAGTVLGAYLLFASMATSVLLFMYGFAKNIDTWMVHHPFLYIIYQRISGHATYFKIDSTIMFELAIKAAVSESVNALTEEQKLAPVGDLDEKPVHESLMLR